MYFETLSAVGPAGSVQFLHVESEDRRVIVQVLARIIRVSMIDDLANGQSVGMAVEFMPSSAEGRSNLERLVRHVIENGLRKEELIDHSFQVQVAGAHQSERTTLQKLNVQKLVLETDWQAAIGDHLQLQIAASPAYGGSLPLDGIVDSVEPVDAGFRVEVRVTGVRVPAEIAKPNTIHVFTDLVAQSVEDFALPSPEHLSGLLSRIKPPTLLGLMEMERLSGELRFINESQQEICLYVRDGRPLDAEGDASLGSTPRELLAALFSWPEGQFNFSLGAVTRDDKLDASMTSLILDLAKEEDEATQGIIPPSDGEDFF